MLTKLKESAKVVGAKRLMKAIEAGEIRTAYVAMDADIFVTQPVIDLCRAKNIPVVEVSNMKQLGETCLIQVPTAAAGIKRD